MALLLLLTFVVGYLFIALEHPLRIDKAASAILTGVLCWTVLIIGQDTLLAHAPAHGDELSAVSHSVDALLLEHLGEIAQILFFLLGAMTIVELVDVHRGFQVVTDRLTTGRRVRLLWMICTITFFFSAALDNLTTAIVMTALLRKLMKDKHDLWLFGGMVIIAANAGGAWSPIGDVTTIMLWIGGQVTAVNIITKLFLPSVLCLLVPLVVVSLQMKGEVLRPLESERGALHALPTTNFEQRLIFWMGVGGLIFVPVFKNLTHLPPFMGMLLSLGVLWVTTEVIHRHKREELRDGLSVAGVIRRIDTPSILFFLGILLAVASLQTAGQLTLMAEYLDKTFGNLFIINILIGLLSAIVDNVPLVAGAMGMYPMSTYPQDHLFWELLAYCAGTGGSILIIGSAAGVAIMGLMKIDFIWYLRKVSWLALIGYLAGVGLFYLMQHS